MPDKILIIAPPAVLISCKYKGEKGELSVPGPLRHSYVRRATAHAHTIPNLKPEIWTKHYVTPFSISYDSYFISLSSLSLILLEPDQSSARRRKMGHDSMMNLAILAGWCWLGLVLYGCSYSSYM